MPGRRSSRRGAAWRGSGRSLSWVSLYWLSRGSEPRQAAPRREDRRPGNGEFRQRRPRGRRDEGEPYVEARDEGDHDERIAADILPPSISASVEDSGEEEAPRAPRRRTRRPRDPNEEIAPAA